MALGTVPSTVSPVDPYSTWGPTLRLCRGPLLEGQASGSLTHSMGRKVSAIELPVIHLVVVGFIDQTSTIYWGKSIFAPYLGEASAWYVSQLA